MFPLLRLPYVALQEVIRSIPPEDLVIMSFASTRIKNLIRSILPKNSIHLELFVYGRVLTIGLGGYQYEVTNVLTHAVPIKMGEEDMELQLTGFWHKTFKIKTDKKLEVVKYFFNLFNQPVVSLITFKAEEPFVLALMQMARQEQCVPNKFLYGSSDSLTPETFVKVLDECSGFAKVTLNPLLNDNVQCSPSNPGVFCQKRFIAHVGPWFKMEDFMNCKDITLKEVKDHVNFCKEFFQKFIGSSWELEKISVELGDRDPFLLIVKKLEQMGFVFNQKDEVEIQREDGKKYDVYYENGDLKMKMQ